MELCHSVECGVVFVSKCSCEKLFAFIRLKEETLHYLLILFIHTGSNI